MLYAPHNCKYSRFFLTLGLVVPHAMKVPPQLISLYWKTARKYRKLATRIHRQGITPYQRHNLLQRLHKVLRKLEEVRTQLRMAAATGTLVLLLNQTPASAQLSPITDAPVPTPNPLGPFVKQDRINNPLREPLFTGWEPDITAVDFDRDGDLDVVLGSYDYNGGSLRYFENKLSDGHPVYMEREGLDNPFHGIHALTQSASPALADIDGDGDLDLFIGQRGAFIQSQYPYSYSRGIEYHRNDAGTFTAQTGAWDTDTKVGNPFDGLQLGNSVSPRFVDFDSDGDLDLIAGSRTNSGFPYYIEKHVHYYQNDGSGSFSPSDITLDTTPYYNWSDRIFPTLADLDDDGDFDMVMGTFYDGNLKYYRQETPGNFIEQTAEWDPVARTGNPFQGFEVGRHVSPVFADFDGDGNIDLFVADESGWFESKYSDRIIDYYRNSGNSTFEQKHQFENPFDGVFVKEQASPVLMDIDGDTDLDAAIGNWYYKSYYDYNLMQFVTLNSFITTYKQENEVFNKVTAEEDTFKDLEVSGSFSPQFADADGDGDLDIISGNTDGQAVFFRNNDGLFNLESDGSPFAGISTPSNSSARLVDIDSDGDLDLFMSNDWGESYYFKNTGTASAPVYESSIENPLADAMTYAWGTAFFQFSDVDHDGDVDVLFNGANPNNADDQAILFVENRGTAGTPVFDSVDATLFQEDVEDSKVFTIDYDGDGDLDVFAGNYEGTVSYLENQNPVVNIATNASAVEYENGTAPVLLSPDLTLSDTDNDWVVQAVVAINNYLQGETLAFTQQPGITGAFDASTGILTFRGKATVADYESILRTVTFETNYQSGRRVSGENTIIAKSVSYAVFDQDFTSPMTDAVNVQVFVNDPPVLVDHTLIVNAGGSATFDLKLIASDPNGANDLDVSSFKILQPPASGALASIDGDGILSIHYTGLGFAGTETLNLEVCDVRGDCDQNLLTVSVTNTAPVITARRIDIAFGGTALLNLMGITSDPEGNLNSDGFAILTQPASGAVATIQVVSSTEANLKVDYAGLTFSGTESILIRACDASGTCGENTVTVKVNAPPIISDATLHVTYGGSATLDLKTVVADPDGSSDLDISSFKVTQQPPSGALASVDVNGALTVNYNTLTFTGSEQFVIEACDQTGDCAQQTLETQVTNSPPVITPEPVAVPGGMVKSINLMNITTDVDGNLDPQAFTIIGIPLSKARASIEVISDEVVNLHLDYEGITYQGTDEITIRACDRAGACSENVVAIDVDVEGNITVYNAVAPNSSGDNRFMRITGLPENNKVSIFSRWGDKVFDVENYVSEESGNAFRGLNNNGSALPSGTYFYTIEIPGRQMITGYLSLKQ